MFRHLSLSSSRPIFKFNPFLGYFYQRLKWSMPHTYTSELRKQVTGHPDGSSWYRWPHGTNPFLSTPSPQLLIPSPTLFNDGKNTIHSFLSINVQKTEEPGSACWLQITSSLRSAISRTSLSRSYGRDEKLCLCARNRRMLGFEDVYMSRLYRISETSSAAYSIQLLLHCRLMSFSEICGGFARPS